MHTGKLAHTNTHARTDTHKHTRAHGHTQTHTRARTHTNTHARTDTHKHTRAYGHTQTTGLEIHAFQHTYKDAGLHARTHARTHACTHAHMPISRMHVFCVVPVCLFNFFTLFVKPFLFQCIRFTTHNVNLHHMQFDKTFRLYHRNKYMI